MSATGARSHRVGGSRRELPRPPEGRADGEADVLAEIDSILDDLGFANRPNAPTLASAAVPVERADPPEPSGRGPSDPPEAGEPTPFLRVRLTHAQLLSEGIRLEMAELDRRADHLRDAVERLNTEVRAAAEELAFVRSTDRAAIPLSIVPTRAAVDLEPAGVAPDPEERSSPFARFTVRRYNETVGPLQRGHRGRSVALLGLAAAISAVLLYLTILSPEPMPGLAIALLPLVWLIPVPFFVAGFRGTHRLLDRHPLELPEAPA